MLWIKSATAAGCRACFMIHAEKLRRARPCSSGCSTPSYSTCRPPGRPGAVGRLDRHRKVRNHRAGRHPKVVDRKRRTKAASPRSPRRRRRRRNKRWQGRSLAVLPVARCAAPVDADPARGARSCFPCAAAALGFGVIEQHLDQGIGQGCPQTPSETSRKRSPARNSSSAAPSARARVEATARQWSSGVLCDRPSGIAAALRSADKSGISNMGRMEVGRPRRTSAERSSPSRPARRCGVLVATTQRFSAVVTVSAPRGLQEGVAEIKSASRCRAPCIRRLRGRPGGRRSRRQKPPRYEYLAVEFRAFRRGNSAEIPCSLCAGRSVCW